MGRWIPTGNLRYLERGTPGVWRPIPNQPEHRHQWETVLQQEWRNERTDRTEWRDVPTVKEL